MATLQAQVKEMYMKVIDATIDSARLEFAENGAGESTLGHLETLKTRWVQRLIATQDFTDDPALVRASSSASTTAANRRGAGAQTPSSKKRTAKAAVSGEAPAKKRPRHEDNDKDPDDGEPQKASSDLGSSSDDSDLDSAGSDPEVDNYILAQHDRVRKATTGKWKVHLKEGIAHINGRDYLFNKAICDLDW